MQTRSDRIRSITRAFGGSRAMAEALQLNDVDTGAVRIRMWATRGYIPAEYFTAIVNAAQARGLPVSLDELADIAAERAA